MDECSTNVRMVPLRARAPKGERAFGKVPKNWDENVTLISSMNLEEAKARSFEALVEATGRALTAVTKEDARAFFTHRGYGMPRALSL